MNRKTRILLIDDDVDIRHIVERLLVAAGYDVMTHDRGFNSTNVISTYRPDLVLLDIHMPFLSGDQLMDLLREDPATREIPIVLFSSNEENELRAMARKLGAAGYITKSAMGFDLPTRVAAFVPRRAPATELVPRRFSS